MKMRDGAWRSTRVAAVESFMPACCVSDSREHPSLQVFCLRFSFQHFFFSLKKWAVGKINVSQKSFCLNHCSRSKKIPL